MTEPYPYNEKHLQQIVQDIAERAAREEWAKRVMEGIEASPNEHADAIAHAVMVPLAIKVWELGYAIGSEDQHTAETLEVPNFPWAQRNNPYTDIGWKKSIANKKV